MKPWQIMITTYLALQVFGFYSTISILNSLEKDFIELHNLKSLKYQ